ncbi:MAG: hypothetical protein EB127_31210, partial [Alphaproteobacteria bacterium]|nr:hypothetical protein [Alphaproteobacteria bacterium]
IALKAGIASGAIAIVLPEDEMSVDELVDTLKASEESGKSSSIVLVAEGSKGGGAYELAKKVNEKYSVSLFIISTISVSAKNKLYVSSIVLCESTLGETIAHL